MTICSYWMETMTSTAGAISGPRIIDPELNLRTESIWLRQHSYHSPMWPLFSTQNSLSDNEKSFVIFRWEHPWCGLEGNSRHKVESSVKRKKVIVGYFCEVTWKEEGKGVTLCVDPWRFSGSHSISSDKSPSVSELFQKSKSNPRTFCYTQNGSPHPALGFVKCAKKHTWSLAKFFG